MYLFIDTETTGIPRNWKAPVTDLDNWPRMVQIAWLLYDKDKNLLEEKNYIIRPDGYTIPLDASSIHRITTDIAFATGNDLTRVLKEISATIDKAKYIIAHNMSFDEKIVGAEFIRKNISHNLFQKKRICTMEETTNFCAIPGNYGYKWPKLSELHYKLFSTHFSESHNAAADIKATAKCFWELKNRGYFSSTPAGYHPPETTITPTTYEKYNSPISSTSTHQNEGTVQQFKFAGFWLRFVATVIDFVIMFIAVSIVWAILDLPIPPNAKGPYLGVWYVFQNPFGLLTNWLYNAIMECTTPQGSLGKMIVGIKVTDLNGNKIGFGKATGRHFGKLISLIILYIGFIMVAFTKRKQGLHDIMANCLVVKK